MANIKITDLDAYADPKSTDVLPAVDVTNDETKKVSIADLMENAGSGTEALPGIAFDGDPNTGIYRPGADQLAISTAGTQRLLISNTGAVTIPGDLTVQGTTTTIDSETLVVKDKNIELGVVDSPTDTTADGGGITLKGATDKTINWVNATDAWTSSERFDFPAGTAATPSIILNGDVNSGIYQPGADQVAVATNGTGRLFIASDGKVGIGNANPSEELEITSATPALKMSDTDEAGSYGTVSMASSVMYVQANGAATDGQLVYRSGNAGTFTERLRITSAGLVGIGTSSPGDKVHIEGAGQQTIRIRNTTTGSNASPQSSFIAFRGYYNVALAQIEVQDRSSSNFGGWINVSTSNSSNVLTNAIHIDSSQRVGIGTASPASKLHVYENSASPARIYLENTEGRYEIKADANLALHYSNQFVFFNAAGTQEYARLDASGRLGIGTNSPDTLLNISSSGNGYRFKIDDTTNNHTVGIYSDATSARIVSVNNAENAYEPFAISGADVRFWIGNSEKARIDAGGKLLVGTTTAINTDSNAVIQAASASGGYYIAARNDTSVTVDNTIGGMRFYGNDSDSIYDECARIECLGDGTHSSTSKPSRLGFYTTGSGAQSPSERLRIANTGALGLSGANYGTSGQVLTSNGSGSAPSWQDGGGAGAAIFAWVNYASNGAIQDSLGISSVTKGGGGYYTFNLSSSQPDDNYVAVGSNGNQSIHNVIPGTTTIGTIHIRRTDGAGVDHPGWAGAFR